MPEPRPGGRARGLGLGTMLLALSGVAALVAIPACGDDQSAWCSDLASVRTMSSMADAMTDGNRAKADRELEHFREVADAAPTAVHDDMVAIADVLAEVVAVGTRAGSPADAEAQRRLERANQQLAAVVEHTDAVSRWAERNCGFRLN